MATEKISDEQWVKKNINQVEKFQKNSVLPASERYYRPGGTTGQLPADCRECPLLEVRQWPGSSPVLPATRYYRPPRDESSFGLEPCNLIHLPFPTYLSPPTFWLSLFIPSLTSDLG